MVLSLFYGGGEELQPPAPAPSPPVLKPRSADPSTEPQHEPSSAESPGTALAWCLTQPLPCSTGVP